VHPLPQNEHDQIDEDQISDKDNQTDPRFDSVGIVGPYPETVWKSQKGDQPN